MDVLEAIATRHSVRNYTNEPVDRAVLEQLLQAAVEAPSAMNTQTWAFGIIQGSDQVRNFAERGRLTILRQLEERGETGDFHDRIADPTFNIFYNAPALVVIYSTDGGMNAEYNCCLAAENFMLAARSMELGTCWIGMAAPLFNDPAVKEELGVPAQYREVSTIIVGHPAEEIPAKPKNPPTILFAL